MWTEQQKALQAFHAQHLAWTLQPKNEEELALIQTHFPRLTYRNKKGAEATLDFDRLQLPEWEGPLFFRDIVSLKLEDAWNGKKLLKLTHRRADGGKPQVTKCYLEQFSREKEKLLGMFLHYYSRHKHAEQASQG